VDWVRERTTPTERSPLVVEVSTKVCGWRVSSGQRDGSLRPCSRISRPELLLFLSSSSSTVLTRLSVLHLNRANYFYIFQIWLWFLAMLFRFQFQVVFNITTHRSLPWKTHISLTNNYNSAFKNNRKFNCTSHWNFTPWDRAVGMQQTL
jgi:hypothetical protein